MSTKRENMLIVIWIISTVATFGSLYFSEILKYEPCKLCWFQRIFMYPLPILIGISIVRKDYHQTWNTLVLACLGFIISIYHNYISLFSVSDNTCGRVSCTTKYFNIIGFITIPFLALISFLSIIILSIIVLKKQRISKIESNNEEATFS